MQTHKSVAVPLASLARLEEWKKKQIVQSSTAKIVAQAIDEFVSNHP